MNSKNVHMKLRLFYSTNAPRCSYIHTNNSIEIGRAFIVSGFVKRVISNFTIIEVTDIDFMTTNFNTVQNMQKSTSSDTSDNRSNIDLIAKDVASVTS